MMKDGLYMVETKYLMAGFVMRGGKITECAPILRKKIDYFMRIARWVCP